MNIPKKLVLTVMCFLVSIILNTAAFAEPQLRLRKNQTLYVPVYSHIYAGDKETPFYLTATLSIRNIDLSGKLTILSADYYDSAGKKIRSYLDAPVTLGPLSATRYVVKESDKSGGSGAGFVVRWKSETGITPPLMEAVMIGTRMQQGISFISRAVEIAE